MLFLYMRTYQSSSASCVPLNLIIIELSSTIDIRRPRQYLDYKPLFN